MTTGMIINLLILAIMALCGVMMGIILWEIRKVRDRLHKVEGGHESVVSTLAFIRDFISDFKDVHPRLVKLETARHK